MEEDEGECLLQPLNPISIYFHVVNAWLASGCDCPPLVSTILSILKALGLLNT